MSLTPVDGPGYWNIDTAIIKRVKFKETLNFELRLEAFNVLNHTNFNVLPDMINEGKLEYWECPSLRACRVP